MAQENVVGFSVYAGGAPNRAAWSSLLGLRSGLALVEEGRTMFSGGAPRSIDMVFYHIRMRFYLLVFIVGHEALPGDVEVARRMVEDFDERVAAMDDGPTMGVLLSDGAGQGVAARIISPLNAAQPFSPAYLDALPSEEELARVLAPAGGFVRYLA